MADKQVAEPAVERWRKQISRYENDFKKWEARGDKILKRYRDEGRGNGGNAAARFNILWSNVQTIVPAVFARLPKPDVSRRFRDNDPVGRVAALILERALEFEVEHYPDYRAAMKGAVYDRYLPGRGVAWIRYEPHFSPVPGVEDDGVQVTEDADTAKVDQVENAEEAAAEEVPEQIDYECAPVDYVHWKDFGHTQGRCWEEVTAVWRRVYMRRAALVERFGAELGEKIPLDTRPDEQKRNGNTDGGEYEACVYEIWDKESGKALWISKGMPKVLDERDDPLQLEGFFPCPKPLYATLTTDSLVPVPDFTLYQDQANSLDELCDRIDGLIHALKVRGCYDASVPELARLFTEGENNTLIAVKNWASFAEKKGLDGSISLVDLIPIFQALNAAYEAMEQQKAQVYEITGLSDIVRGQGEAQETATAQKLKGQYASLRLKSMQGDVSQFAAELLQLKAQVICRFFQPETIAQIAAVQQLNDADKQHIEAAIALLKDDRLADFRIEVSADSLVQIDEDAEKQAATELVSTIGTFIRDAAQAPPEAIPFLGEMLKFAFSRYKIGKTIEGQLDQFVDQAKQQAAQPKPPSPEQLKAQAEEKKLAAEAEKQQMEAARAQQESAMEAQRMQQEQQIEGMRMQIEQAQAQAEQAREAAQVQLEQMRLAQESRDAERDRQFQIVLQQMKDASAMRLQTMKDENALEQAQIASATTLQAAQESAAEKATEQGK